MSLKSKTKEVWIAGILIKGEYTSAGILTLQHYTKSMRIYSIAVLDEYRKWKIGSKLIQFSVETAKGANYEKITLEVLKNNHKLVAWYEQFGFKTIAHLKDYYAENIDALKMSLPIKERQKKHKLNLIIYEQSKINFLNMDHIIQVSARDYLSLAKYQKMKNARVFNLCDSYKYQGMGYYVSLLASARGHRVIPSATTMNDYRNAALIKSLSFELDQLIQNSLSKHPTNKFCLNLFFGQSQDPKFKQLAQELYLLFETPLLQVKLLKADKWYISGLVPLTISKIDKQAKEYLKEAMQRFFPKRRLNIPRLVNYKYDIAILINKEEATPPSCPKALRMFQRIAESMCIYTEFITRKDINRLNEFDALFIRETTNVNDHTYNIARTAYAEGLVVLDDPWSILRCSNKIFLYERMSLNGIAMPFSKVLSKRNFMIADCHDLDFPLVLKQPDGSFSKGVKKVNNMQELSAEIKILFENSELIVAQEFLPSEFDWRIGLIDNQPIFACKYFMAKGHWQIYNWKQKKKDLDGDYESVCIEDVPEKVIQTAVKAASLMGDGLYGVDIKEINGDVYLIEVNDNPNIDFGIEDSVLKDELYRKILQSFVNRIEVSKNISQYIAADPT